MPTSRIISGHVEILGTRRHLVIVVLICASRLRLIERGVQAVEQRIQVVTITLHQCLHHLLAEEPRVRILGGSICTTALLHLTEQLVEHIEDVRPVLLTIDHCFRSLFD